MTKTQRLAVVLTIVNAVVLVVLLSQHRSVRAQGDPSVLRGQGFELVDAAGQVRAQFTVESNGEAVFRMRDAKGTIRVKLGASTGGSGLLLLNDATEPGVHIRAGSTTTSINLTGADGQQRVITP
jgi:hypothetical protein